MINLLCWRGDEVHCQVGSKPLQLSRHAKKESLAKVKKELGGLSSHEDLRKVDLVTMLSLSS
jgi:hypothetical protein